MVQGKSESNPEEPKAELLKEWLSRIGSKNRAYIKGASKALIHVQEISGDAFEQVNIEEASARG